MRKPKFLLALAPCCLALMAISSSASPLASGLASKNATLPALNNGLLQKVQSWPCREKRKDMSADERRFCYRYYHRYYYYDRSEEHTSELQSRRDLVCRLLLEKKKKTK